MHGPFWAICTDISYELHKRIDQNWVIDRLKKKYKFTFLHLPKTCASHFFTIRCLTLIECFNSNLVKKNWIKKIRTKKIKRTYKYMPEQYGIILMLTMLFYSQSDKILQHIVLKPIIRWHWAFRNEFWVLKIICLPIISVWTDWPSH